MKKFLRQIVLSSLLLASFSGTVQSATFNRLIVLGDSVSDGGTYSQAAIVTAPFIIGGNLPTTTLTGDAMLYRFMDNNLDGSSQTYAESLADMLNLPLTPAIITGVPAGAIPDINTNGGNYAQGGARVTDTLGYFQNEPFGFTAQPVATQISNLLASSPVLSSSDLIIVWAGVNDIFFQVESGLDSATVTANVLTAASDVLTQVNRLKAAGATNIMVVSAPDMGNNQPWGATGGGTGDTDLQALYTSLSGAFNTQLYSSLSGSNAVIMDADKLLGAILDDPTRYGFSAIDQRRTFECTVSSLYCVQGINTLDDGNLRVFADSTHPSTQAHLIFAQAAFAGLQAIAQNGALTVGTLSALRQQSLGLDNRLNTDAFYMTDVNGRKQHRPNGHIEIYGGVEDGSYEVDAGQVNPEGKGSTQVAKIAMDTLIFPGVVLGGGFSIDRGEVDFSGGRGGFDSRLITGAIFGVAELSQNVYANFSAAYGDIDVYDVDRSFQLGPATEHYTASTSGKYKSASVGLGAMFGLSSEFKLNPTIKYTAESITMDGYTESNGAASLSYGNQTYDGRRLSLGLAGFFTPTSLPKLTLGLRRTFEHDYNDDDIKVSIGPTANNLATVESSRGDTSFGYLSTTIAYEISHGSSLVFTASKVVDLDNNDGKTFGLTLIIEL
jgi:outer membrane lipase/esterase